MKKIIELLTKLKKTGFFSIYLSTICSKVITLLGGVLIVRLLSPEDYGVYTLVLNAIAMLSIFGDMGSSSSILQYGIEAENDIKKQSGFFKLGIILSMFSSILSSILILCSAIFYPYQTIEVQNLTIIMFGIPILTSLINYISVIFRVKRKNHWYSFYQVLYTLIHYIVIIISTIIAGLKGSLVAQYIYNIVVFVVGLLLIKKLNIPKEKGLVDKIEKKRFIKLAISSQINGTINNLLYTIDIFILGIMMKSEEVAMYKVSTVIPNALIFLPQCLAIYLVPYYISHNKDRTWIEKTTRKILMYTFPFYFLITIMLIILSVVIINILYGEQYLDAVLPFNILMIGFFFVAFVKNLFSNIIYTLHKVKFNIAISTISIILNIILDVIFIYTWKMIGVAISTMLVDIMSSIITILYYKKCIKNLEDKKEK